MTSFVTAIFLACVLALVQAVEDDCIIKGRGKITQFSNTKTKIMIPCKYQATTFHCEGYKVHVAPVQALDTKARYYTDAVMVSIERLATGEFWKGRTTAKHVERYFNDTDGSEQWVTRDQQINRNSDMVMHFEPGTIKTLSSRVSVQGVPMYVEFFGYEEGRDKTMKANGVRMYCESPAFDNRGAFPTSLCGNFSDKALGLHTKDIGLKKHHLTIIHDVLNSEIDISNPTCEVAQRVFQRCNHKAAAVKACSSLLTKQNVRTCLDKNYRNPMDIFIYCIRYVCDDHREACNLMREALEGCPKNQNLPGAKNRCKKAFKIKT